MHTLSQHISLPAYAQSVMDVLEAAGFECWVVGGFVRDALMGRPSHDVDLATNATWPEVQRVCVASGMHTHETGTAHGTLTVVVGGQHAVEVTTYRADGTYSDARHPNQVTFVRTIEEDVARRDFTINALAYHPKRGILDVYDGMSDMQAGIIRIVGDANKRFAEDGLRILRACRFASQLGFSIESATYQAMVAHKHLLGCVSPERITHELDELLLGAHVHDALMSTVDVLAFVLPELVAMKGRAQHTPYHIYDVLEHTAWAVQYMPATRLARWTALFHDMGKPAAAFFDEAGVEHFYGHARVSGALARGVMDRLLMSSAFKAQVLTLVKYHDDVIEATPRAIKRALRRLGGDADLFRVLCAMKRADALSQAPQCAPRVGQADKLEELLDEVLAAQDAFTVAKLAISGNDVLALGVEPGPAVGAALEAALDAVIDERVPNERDALLEMLRKHL